MGIKLVLTEALSDDLLDIITEDDVICSMTKELSNRLRGLI